MASETAPPVNGIYSGQYGGPAELAATPATSHSQTSSSNPATTSKADPQEIGWYFVEQYYTTLSKNPDRIHLFYGKKSQLVTGVEAEKVVPAVGVKAIGEKIKELDIQDCKVRVLNVDSQSSDKSIVVQVIGEMSNKSEPHHKFVQTFVLAEQPNGYYVLNDIFRYLNEDEDEIIEDEAVVEQKVSEEPAVETAPAVEAEKSQESVTDEAAAEQVDAKLEEHAKAEAIDEEQPEEDEEEHEEPEEELPADINGISTESTAEEASEAGESEATKDVPEETVQAPLVAENPLEPEHTPAQSPPKTSVTPAPVADAPPAKKTWANLVGSKAPAIPALPTQIAPAPSQPKAQKSPQPAQPLTSSTETAASITSQGNGWQTADHSKKQNRPQSKTTTEQTALAYIKNVNEKVDARVLREVLEKYGELKYFDVSRQRNCAFVEFADSAGYNAAVAANPHAVGTEQIFVEERRPRPNAFGGSNAGFTRGGGNVNAGRGRGGLQGRTGSSGGGFQKDATRGTFQQRGGKSGNVTPKGRGQAQPA